MARRRLEDKNIRKLGKSGSRSITVTIPIDIVRALRWLSKQKVVVRKSGSKIIIEDWKE